MPSFWDTVKVSGQDMKMYASVPDGSGPFPGGIVIHPAGGVNEFPQRIADQLAGEGYVAVCPDLFHRITDANMTGVEKAQSLQDPEIVADVNAAVDFLQANSAVNGQRIGITGFCMGGRVSWLAAASIPAITASVPYYGGSIMKVRGGEKTPFDLASGISGPMLFHFGEEDADPSQEDMRTLDNELTRLGKTHQFYTYAGANHAFADHTSPRYHQRAFEISWPRTLEFFAAHLKGAAVAG